MSLSAVPNVPVHTPQSRSSSKNLQLTPVWEEVVKNNRLPSDVSQDLIFQEISVRLEDLEWPVRQHGFRVLCDIIPIIPREHLDEQFIQNNILGKIVVNLGHPAPGIRKAASETIQKYLRRTSQTERMLRDFLQYGVKEEGLVSCDQTGILRENITLGTIVTLVEVLKPFIIPENGGYSLSHPFLADIAEALVEKTKSTVYREKSVETLWNIKQMMGETRFFRLLENHPEKEHIINMMRLKGGWSNENSLGVLMNQDSFDMAPPEGDSKKNDNVGKGANSEDFSDGTDTETYTKEPAPTLDDESIYYHINRAEVSHYTAPSFVPIEHSDNYLSQVDSKGDEEEKGSGASSPRVVLEAEIQFAKNKAITMKVMGDEGETPMNDRPDTSRRFITESGDLVMKVLQNSNNVDDEEKTRTPRRVRFGGEVIKLRTPDSDTTDITIEIHETSDKPLRKEPIITITPENVEVEEKNPTERGEIYAQSPEALITAKKPSSRAPSPSRRGEKSKIPVLKESCLSPKSESFDSAPSSSGSEGDLGEKWSDEEESAWKWAELRVVEENILKDLKNKENWKIQYQALEQLKVVLINPKVLERIAKLKNQEKIKSLFRYLLHELPQNNNYEVTTLALSIVAQLIETLPKELILLDVRNIVQGLCRYFGGCRNLNLKIEAIQSLKMLFGILEPSAVINILIGEGCLFSSSSKLRENSLLAIMYATMTFPSDIFDIEKILEKVATSVADSRRRVRHGSLEAIAVLSQFCSSQALTDSIARVVRTLSTSSARAQLIAAVKARLSRRLLPTISSEGLVLYALQIPASRRFGNLGNPLGADVDWILSGTGSVSTGSAKSRTQLNAAQKLDVKSSAPLSPSKWAQSKHGPKPHLGEMDGNPWKIQKHRTEFSLEKTTNQRFYKTQSTGNLNESNFNKDLEPSIPNSTGPEKRLKPEEITWALVPVSALEEPLMGKERSNSLWGESLGDNIPHYLSSSFGPLRPMYLKLQPNDEQFILSRSTDDVRRNSFSYAGKKDLEDFTEIRLLTPTILREKTYSDNYYQNEKLHKNDGRGSSDTPTKIPILCSNSTKGAPRAFRSTQQIGKDRRISESENASSPSQILTRLNNGFPGTPAFLPNIHTGHPDPSYNIQKSPSFNKFADADEMKLQDTMSQLSDLLSTSTNAGKFLDRDFYSVRNSHELEVDKNEKEPEISVNKIQVKTFERAFFKNHEPFPNAVASAPPVISTDIRDQVPSTSSSNSTDLGTLTGNELRVKKLTNGSDALESSSVSSYRNHATYNPKVRGKKTPLTKTSNKIGMNGTQFSENLKPFERPKEGLDTCFIQLESQQWEVNMLGLTSLIRLLRHHPAIVLSQLHPIIVALARQIRNLRSQVARVACQASAEMFVVLKRNVEPDLEELSGPLFHRSADTNRFIRADCNHALDNMVDHVGHAKVISAIIAKGTTHQNATVRTVAARLLLRLSEKAGAEKLLSLPKETRDKMLQAGANLLTEGKLETRAFAKQVFRIWSSHPSFTNLILEAVQPNVMRRISKTLMSLKS